MALQDRRQLLFFFQSTFNLRSNKRKERLHNFLINKEDISEYLVVKLEGSTMRNHATNGDDFELIPSITDTPNLSTLILFLSVCSYCKRSFLKRIPHQNFTRVIYPVHSTMCPDHHNLHDFIIRTTPRDLCKSWSSMTCNFQAVYLIVVIIIQCYYYNYSYIATGLRAGWPRNRGSVPGRGKIISFLHSVSAGPGTRPASYTMDTWGCFAGE
jgi:hypothetical protein